LAKFWFFTDADRLAAQDPAQAFGPVGGNEATQFRVTDLHKAVDPSPAALADQPRAYAICEGLLRAQEDGNGGLTLILKPTGPPPFEFPSIAYFLYKGIDLRSLLDGGVLWPLIKLDASADIPLIDQIKKDWIKNDLTGDPTRQCLGLHLHPATPITPGLNPSLYADDKPLDHLIYQGDGRFPARLVSAGDRIGSFLPTRFGLEIVVSRIGPSARIGYARSRENIVTVDAPPANTTAPNDKAAFLNRHAREEILNFIDPCAFWGCFHQSGLSAHGVGPIRKVDGSDVYRKLLRGGGSAPRFVNHNRAYIDIRDDHGHSMNYFRATGDNVRLALPPVPQGAPALYYRHGWPSFFVDPALLPATAKGDFTPLAIALPAAPGARPTIFVSVGYAARSGSLVGLGDRDRFITALPGADGFQPDSTLLLPVARIGSSATLQACYLKLHQFRRVPRADPASTPAAVETWPFNRGATANLFPVPGGEPFPRKTSGCAIRTFSDLVYVEPAEGRPGCVARPGIARDKDNFFLFLFPVAVAAGDGRSRLALPPDPPVFLSYEELATAYFRPDRLLESGERLATRTIQAPSGNATVPVELAHERVEPLANADFSDNFWGLAMSAADYDTLALALANAVAGTGLLSLADPVAGPDEYEALGATLSYLKAPAGTAPLVERVDGEPFRTLYRHHAAS
jgi:hypothetical protein